MSSRKPKRLGTFKGAAATELALLAPVLTYLGLISADFSRLFFAQATLNDSARAGAMYYATHPTASASAIEQVALADTTNLSPTPTVASASWKDAAGDTYVQVTLRYTFSTVIANPSIPSSTTLSSSVVMMANPS